MIRSGSCSQAPLDQRARGQRDLALELLGLDVAGWISPSTRARSSAPARWRSPPRPAPRAPGGRRPASAGRRRASRPAPPGRLRGRARRRRRRWARPRDEQAARRTAVPASRPSASSRVRNSAISRDLPVPASPTRLTTWARPSLHPVEGREQLIELVRAPDHRRREPVGREPARRSRLGERAEQAVDDDRLGLAAQGQLAGRLEREAMPRERMGGLGYQDRPRGRGPRRRDVVFTVSPVTA